jgi:hypothetical protein
MVRYNVYKSKEYHTKFEIHTSVTMNGSVLWDVTWCSQKFTNVAKKPAASTLRVDKYSEDEGRREESFALARDQIVGHPLHSTVTANCPVLHT